MESHHPRKVFVGGLSADTREKDLERIFCKFGHIAEVTLLKHGKTKRSRGFGFITFESPADAERAVKGMDGKRLDGKVIKVEPAGKSFSDSGDRGRRPVLSRNKGKRTNQNYGRRANGGARGHSSCERHFGNDLKYPYENRGLKASPMSHGKEKYEVMPQRKPVSFQRDDSASRRHVHSTKDRGDHPSFGDIQGFAAAPREYGYNDGGRYSSREEPISKGYSDCGGYDGRYDRNYCSRGGLYGDAYDAFGDYHNAPTTGELPRTYGANSHYDDNPSSQHEHSRKHENAARSQSGLYGGKRKRGLLSSMERGYHAPRDSGK